MENITTTDLYEGCYYLLNGCSLTAIEGRMLNGKISCEFTFEGDNVIAYQLSYFQSKAEVNLFQFRRAYGQMSSYVHNARKKFKNEKRQEQLSGGEV